MAQGSSRSIRMTNLGNVLLERWDLSHRGPRARRGAARPSSRAVRPDRLAARRPVEQRGEQHVGARSRDERPLRTGAGDFVLRTRGRRQPRRCAGAPLKALQPSTRAHRRDRVVSGRRFRCVRRPGFPRGLRRRLGALPTSRAFNTRSTPPRIRLLLGLSAQRRSGGAGDSNLGKPR